MLSKIIYAKSNRQIGSTPWPGTLDDTIKVAKDGLIRHQADRAIVIDDTGKVVWTSSDV